jgi:hypothetical protein
MMAIASSNAFVAFSRARPAGEHLVEMDVGLDERRRGEVAGGVELLDGGPGDSRGDGLDAAAGDADVGEAVARGAAGHLG